MAIDSNSTNSSLPGWESANQLLGGNESERSQQIETPSNSKPTNEKTARPYIDVKFGGMLIRSLVDTGSSRTFMGANGLSIINEGKYRIHYSRRGVVMIANGTIETIMGEALIPITLGDVTQFMAVKKIPGLTDLCVLCTRLTLRTALR